MNISATFSYSTEIRTTIDGCSRFLYFIDLKIRKKFELLVIKNFFVMGVEVFVISRRICNPVEDYRVYSSHKPHQFFLTFISPFV